MNLRIRRRQFGQLALASAATTVLTNLTTKTVAQQPQLVIHGVRLTPSSRDITADLVDREQANKTSAVILQSLDLATGQELLSAEIGEQFVQNQQELTEIVNKAFVIKKPSERIAGFTVLSDGTFVVAVVAATTKGDFSRFVFFSQNNKRSASKSLKAKKIKKHNTVESLLAIQNDRLVSVVSTNFGQPPFNLAIIDSKSGQVDDAGDTLAFPSLPPFERFSNLAQSPDGTIYATNIDSEGVPILVKFDLTYKSPITGRGIINRLVQLSFNNYTLENDIASLAFSPSGQLFALADPTYTGTNSLFTVNLKTGEMQLLRKFAVDKITFARA